MPGAYDPPNAKYALPLPTISASGTGFPAGSTYPVFAYGTNSKIKLVALIGAPEASVTEIPFICLVQSCALGLYVQVSTVAPDIFTVIDAALLDTLLGTDVEADPKLNSGCGATPFVPAAE